MKYLHTNAPGRIHRAITFPTLVGIMMLIMGGLVGAVWSLWEFSFSSNVKLKRAKQAIETKETESELERRKGSNEAKMAGARMEQEELLGIIRQATNSLFRAYMGHSAMRSELAYVEKALTERGVAARDIVGQAKVLFADESDGLPTGITFSHLLAARRLELLLSDYLGTSYAPEAELGALVRKCAKWADTEMKGEEEFHLRLDALKREAKLQGLLTELPPNPPPVNSVKVQHQEAASPLRKEYHWKCGFGGARDVNVAPPKNP